jgi:hypothetical protein
VPPEVHFKGEDGEGLAHIAAHDSRPPLAPCPELRRHVVDHRYTAAVQGAGHAQVKGGRVNDDAYIRLALGDGAAQAAKARVDAGQMAENLGDAHHGDVFGVHQRFTARGTHALAAQAKNFKIGPASAQGFDELRAVHVAGGFAGGDKDAQGASGSGESDGSSLVISRWQMPVRDGSG